MQTLADASTLTGPQMAVGDALLMLQDVVSDSLGIATHAATLAVLDAVARLVVTKEDDNDSEFRSVSMEKTEEPALERGPGHMSPPKSKEELLIRFVKYIGDEITYQDEASFSAMAGAVGMLRTGAMVLTTAARLATRAFASIVRFAWRFSVGLGRVVVTNIIRPAITGMISFAVANPIGAAALVAAGGASYLLYRFFRGQSTPDGEEDLPDTSMLDDPAEPLMAPYSKGDSSGWYDRFKPSRSSEHGADEGQRVSMDSVKAQKAPAVKGNAKAAQAVIATTMDEVGMTSPVERAMFLAQLSHESGHFRYMSEIWGPTAAQRRYEGRKDLGNVQSGDGFRFRGRGFIQITGRTNYAAAGKYLGIDLVGNPDLASDLAVAAKVAVWYWRVARTRIPALAQAGNVKAVTKLINGGYNGLSDRIQQFNMYLAAIKAGEFGGAGEKPAPPVEEKTTVAPMESVSSAPIVSDKPKAEATDATAQKKPSSTPLPKQRATTPVIINGRIVQAQT